MTESTKKKIAAARPWFTEDDIASITREIGDVLRGGRLILGPRAAEVERAYAARLGVEHAVAVSSCTAALEIAFRHVGVAGREVIVPTNTFVATGVAVMNAGGTPVFCDLDPGDWCLSVDDALSRVTSRTAAIVVVHVAGYVASGIERLRRECKQRGLALVEDCAHAHGARAGDREAGALGDIGCFSFYPTKVLTSATGGLVATNDAALADLARSLRHHGQGASLEQIVRPGNDWVLDEVRAVILSAQLRKLDEFLSRRRAVAARYDRILADEPRIVRSRPAPGTAPAYYKYPVVLPEGVDRDRVRARLLEEHAVETGSLYWPPCHLMPLFRNALGTGPGMLPVAEAMLARQLTLPMHAALEPSDADASVAALLEVLGT